PEEERTSRTFVEPFQSATHDFLSPALDGLVSIRTPGTQTKACIVDIESAIKTRCCAFQWIKHQRSHKSRSVVPVLMQNVGQVGQPGREGYSEIIDVIELRIRARQDRSVRRRRQWHVRVGAGEDEAVSSERIKVRRELASGSQEAHAVRASSVQRNQDYVGSSAMRG